MTRSVIAYVPMKAGFDLLRVHTGAIIIKSDRLRPTKSHSPVFSWDVADFNKRLNGKRPDWIDSTDFQLNVIDFQEVSLSRELTRTERAIAIAWELTPPSASNPDGPHIKVAFPPKKPWHERPLSDDVAFRRYGLTATYSNYDVSLWKAILEAEVVRQQDARKPAG